METTLKHRLKVGGIGLAGLAAGVVLAGTITAVAADSGSNGSTNEGQAARADEKALTGTTADKVKAAALAKYPGATVVRVETDSGGVYEAHLVKSDGTPVTVEVDKSFKVTGEEAQGYGHGRGGPGAGETPLTGTTADKVKAAALAKYPGATVMRVETDSDGVYEAHLVKSDGTPVTVKVDKSFKVTGEETGGPGGFGDHDGDGPGQQGSDESSSSVES